MKRLFYSLILVFAASASTAAESDLERITIKRSDMPANAPRVDAYPAHVGLDGKPRVIIDRSEQRTWSYRTKLREAAARGPNFAGHHRLVYWGCGTACFEWAIIDLKTGKVHHPAELRNTEHMYVDGTLFTAEGPAMQFSRQSELLIVAGTINHDPAQRGITWFRWSNGQLHRLLFVAKPYQ